MKRLIFYPYKMYCSSAKLLVEELIKRGVNARRVFPDKNYRPKTGDVVINWGCSTTPNWKNPLGNQITVLNKWDNIPNAVNKIRAFARFKAQSVSCPEATVDPKKALEWVTKDQKVVIGRSTLTGFGGSGIVIISKPEEFVSCPLYTVYKPKKKEFRIHVFKGKVIDAQEKRKSKDAPVGGNSKVRTHSNGWVFCRENVQIPADAAELCVKAVASLGLDFGGVDLIWNEKENKSYILEVNSAPGIEGTTVTNYANELMTLVQ